jgi:hypothetical protein
MKIAEKDMEIFQGKEQRSHCGNFIKYCDVFTLRRTLPLSTAVTWPRVTWRANAGHPLPHQRQRNRHCHCYVNRQRYLL